MNKTETLYHGSPYPITGCINPGKTPDISGQKGNFVFGTGNRPLAMGYSLRTHDNFAGCNTTPDMPFVIFKDRQEFLANPPSGLLYQMPKSHFTKTPLPNDVTDEWQSSAAVPIIPELTERVTCESAMAAGVQIFTLAPGVTVTQWQDFCSTYAQQVDMTNPASIDKAVKDSFIKGIEEGLITHENRQLGINPHPLTPAINPVAALKAQIKALAAHVLPQDQTTSADAPGRADSGRRWTESLGERTGRAIE